ncbi:MAG: methyl-accepting chemotaxis protein [Acetobacteraceae bacterium]|nr:methyl-accepting chemotaxis protein [Acetobacteraceae bacterium]
MGTLTRLRRRIGDISITRKSIAVFASLLLVVLGLGVTSILRLGMIKDAGATISASWMPGVQRAGEIAEASNAYRDAESTLVMSPDADTMAEMKKNLALALTRIEAARIALGKLPTTKQEAGFIVEFNDTWNAYLALSSQIIGLVEQKKITDAADLLTGDSAYQFIKAKALVGRLLVAKVKGGDDAVAGAAALYQATIPVMLGAIVIAILLGLGAAGFVIFGVARPLTRLTAVVGRMAGGDLEVADKDMPGLGRGDEFGALTTALSVLRDSARERVRLEREAIETRATADVRQADMERYTQDFGMSVSGVMLMLSNAAEGISESAAMMSRTAENTRAQADTTASGSMRAAQSLSAVAAAAEEMAVTASEVGRRIGDVTSSTEAAVEAVGRSERIVTALVDAVAEIGSVVQMISDIAGQTNLLALNATIEAARAGEAGKGFAVVAGEVKTLATNTRKATEAVSARILSVRASTDEARQAIGSVTTAISRVHEAAGEIAASIEQQGLATREIACSVQSVSNETDVTTRAMTALSLVADETSSASKTVLDAAGRVRHQTVTLREEVDNFLLAARTASGDRRAYQRLSGRGLEATLCWGSGTSARQRLLVADISRGGVGLQDGPSLPPGTEVTLEISGVAKPIPARVARMIGTLVGLSFRQDADTLVLIGQALKIVEFRAIEIAA